MADEFDVFAGAMKGQQKGGSGQGRPGRKPFHKKFNRGGGQGPKGNNSPLRGSNGEESVNPLLNAPLPLFCCPFIAPANTSNSSAMI